MLSTPALAPPLEISFADPRAPTLRECAAGITIKVAAAVGLICRSPVPEPISRVSGAHQAKVPQRPDGNRLQQSCSQRLSRFNDIMSGVCFPCARKVD